MDVPAPRRFPLACALLLSLLAGLASAATGRSPGLASVTADGQAAYSMPLWLPTGTNGLTPQLSLEYRHRSPGGLLGAGWSLGGLSQVERCPRTLAQDGIAGAVTQYPTDRFCLDGQRLVVVNGQPYGSALAEYRTEIESQARIRTQGTAGTGPQSFTVEGADGLVREYGATSDSRIAGNVWSGGTVSARVWAINRIRDRSGNVIDFAYTRDASNGSYRITTISYNANPSRGVAASHLVSFVYESRPSSEVDLGYAAGMPVREVLRLDRVDISAGGALLRRYDLQYEPMLSSAGRSRLAAVQECGQDPQDCLAATTFRWQDGTPGLGAEASFPLAQQGSPWVPPERRAWLADINRDGRDDFVALGGTNTAPTLRYRLSSATGFGPEVDTGVTMQGGATPIDFNGDGRMDVLFIGGNGCWQLMAGTATGLAAPIDTGIAPGSLIDFRGADINGDGLGDIAWTGSETWGGGLAVRVLYAQPGGTYTNNPVVLYEQTSYEWAQGGQFIGPPGRRIDFDNDGREDLLVNEDYSIARVSMEASTQDFFEGSFAGGTPLDVNGDGCTDFAYSHWAGGWRIRFSGCWLYWTGPEVAVPGAANSQALALDWNGDGNDDILLRGASSWQVLLSNGTTLAPPVNTGLAHASPELVLAGDWDGDGLDDFLSHGGSLVRLRPHLGLPPDLLLGITDGYGVATSFSYRPTTDPAIHEPAAAASYPDQAVLNAGSVVASLSRTDGSASGATTTTHYRYRGLRRNLHGRGWLGFAWREASDLAAQGEGRIEVSYRQDHPFTGLPQAIIRRSSSGTLVADASIDWAATSQGSGPGLRRQPYIATRTDRYYEAEGAMAGQLHTSVRHGIAAVDASSGLATDQSTTVTEHALGSNPGATHVTRLLHSLWLNDTTQWCLGRPRTTQLTRSHSLPGGAAITENYSQDWDAGKCRPTRQIAEPGSSQWQVTRTLAYDNFGNLASDSLAGINMSPRVTTLSWGARGQVLERITNALGQSVQLAWHYGLGVPTSNTDANGLVTRWSYDSYARVIGETLPDATQSRWTHGPCAAGCDPRARSQLSWQSLDNTGAEFHRALLDMDGFGRPVRAATQMPGGGFSETRLEYDTAGRVLREYRPYWSGLAHEGFVEYAYDSLGRPRQLSDHGPAGNVQRSLQWQYEGLGLRQVDARGFQSQLAFSAWGDLLQVTDAAGGRSHYRYDAAGRPLQATDPAGNVVASGSYNARGMLLSLVEMNRGSQIFTANALGETLTRRNARGQLTSYGYDLLGRLISRSEPEGNSSWTWGNSAAARNIGQLAALAGPGYSESRSYDTLGRLASRTITSDATYRYDFGYSPAGLLDSLTYPASADGYRLKLGYEYSHGQLSRIRDFNAPATVPWQLWAVDASGRILDESLGASIRVQSSYDPVSGQLATRRAGIGGGSSLQDLAYEWDAGDNLLRRRDLNQSLIEEFDYDALGRLDQSRLNGQLNLDLNYDATGNISYKSDAGAYAYHPAQRHAVTQAGSRSYAYDASGNMTSRNGTSISWLSFDLPASLGAGSSNNSQFSYTPGRNRWRQQATIGGLAETTIYVGGLMEKVSSGGSTRYRHYIQAPGGTAAIYQNRAGAPASTWYLTHDHLGSTDRVLDANGIGVAASASFAAFGERRGAAWSGPATQADISAYTATTRDGYTSHEHLDHLGLVHMNMRLYDPVLARFLSVDPVIQAPYFSQSLNGYSYAWNNPLSRVDPTGMQSIPCLENARGNCVQVTVYGLREYMAGWVNAGMAGTQGHRDPCGQDGSALACAMRSGQVQDAASVVLTPGSASDPVLSGPQGDFLRGTAARLGNIAMGAVPVFWLFGDSSFEWFQEPGSSAGRGGAALGNIGYLAGGGAGVLRSGGSTAVRLLPAPGHVPNAGGRIVSDVTKRTETFYRVYSGEARTGAFLTRTPPASRAQAFESLALPPVNAAEFLQEVIVPAGTRIQRSRTLPAFGRRGGSEQFELLERIPDHSFGPGVPLR